MRVEVRLAATEVGDVRVQLGRREACVAEHLLDAAQVGAALEEMCCERVAEEMRMNATRLEAGAVGELPQDQEGAGTSECPAARVEEQVGPMSAGVMTRRLSSSNRASSFSEGSSRR